MALDKQHSDDNWRKHMSDIYLTYLLALWGLKGKVTQFALISTSQFYSLI